MSEAKQSTSTYCQNTRCRDRPEGLSVLGFFPIRALVVVSSDRAKEPVSEIQTRDSRLIEEAVE